MSKAFPQVNDLARMSAQGGDDCIIWPYVINKLGYGKVRHDGKSALCHRAAFQMKHGPIPPKMHVMHKCNNKACINLRHLELGTASQNTSDAFRDGLIKPARGPSLPHTKLSEPEVLAIRKSTDRGVDLARAYGVSPATICLIRKGTNWSYLT